jgi:hypothetical protein
MVPSIRRIPRSLPAPNATPLAAIVVAVPSAGKEVRNPFLPGPSSHLEPPTPPPFRPAASRRRRLLNQRYFWKLDRSGLPASRFGEPAQQPSSRALRPTGEIQFRQERSGVGRRNDPDAPSERLDGLSKRRIERWTTRPFGGATAQHSGDSRSREERSEPRRADGSPLKPREDAALRRN